MNIGLIGAGNIGDAARGFIRAGHTIALSNSRGPESLQWLTAELGERARALAVQEAAQFSDLVMEAIPYGQVDSLPTDALAGKILISASNYSPHRNGGSTSAGRPAPNAWPRCCRRPAS